MTIMLMVAVQYTVVWEKFAVGNIHEKKFVVKKWSYIAVYRPALFICDKKMSCV